MTFPSVRVGAPSFLAARERPGPLASSLFRVLGPGTKACIQPRTGRGRPPSGGGRPSGRGAGRGGPRLDPGMCAGAVGFLAPPGQGGLSRPTRLDRSLLGSAHAHAFPRAVLRVVLGDSKPNSFLVSELALPPSGTF